MSGKRVGRALWLVLLLLMVAVSAATWWVPFRLNLINIQISANLFGSPSARAFEPFGWTQPEFGMADQNGPRIFSVKPVSLPMVVAEFKAKRYVQALQQSQALLSRDDRNLVVWALKGDILWKMDETLAAIESWRRAGFYKRLLDGGQYLREQGQLALAQAAFEAAIAANPGDWRGYLSLGSLFWDHGDVEGAIQVFEAMAAKRSKTMGDLPYAYLGLIYAEREQYDKALGVLQDGLSLWPDSIPIRTSQGIALARSGREDAAVVVLQAVLADDPAARDACYWLGWAYAHKGDDVQAALQYLDCVSRFPNDTAIRYELGLSLMRQGRADEARAQFVTILEVDPSFQAARDRLLELLGTRP